MPVERSSNFGHWRRVLLMLGILAGGGCSGDAEMSSSAEIEATSSLADAPARDAARIFISGHSLTGPPVPDYMARVADSLGTPMAWNQQHLYGSTIKQRARGRGDAAAGWQGYRQGVNRDGEGLDVVAELRRPQTVTGGAYDALVITEQHGILGSLVWDDTVRYLRHFHERLIEGNPQATTYFYHSWIGLDDKNDPRRWIAYEREAAELWDCVAMRVNHSLAAEGRADRIRSLPAATALANLVERATSGPGLTPISGATVRQTMDRLFTDDVHLTAPGAYYVALASYAEIYRRSPEGAWFPQEVEPEEAKVLQQAAWASVQASWRRSRPVSLKACRSSMVDSFIDTYTRYVRDQMKDAATMRAYAWWLRHAVKWRNLFRREDASNPLFYDEASDRSLWLPAPPR